MESQFAAMESQFGPIEPHNGARPVLEDDDSQWPQSSDVHDGGLDEMVCVTVTLKDAAEVADLGWPQLLAWVRGVLAGSLGCDAARIEACWAKRQRVEPEHAEDGRQTEVVAEFHILPDSKSLDAPDELAAELVLQVRWRRGWVCALRVWGVVGQTRVCLSCV
eukprot:3569661-Rhodomonas_salina.1